VGLPKTAENQIVFYAKDSAQYRIHPKKRYHYEHIDRSTPLSSDKLMNMTEWIGSAAATLTTSAFLPQVWKIWRSRHTADISLYMYALFTTGVGLWMIYGIALNAWPIILANGITLILASAVLMMKIKFG